MNGRFFKKAIVVAASAGALAVPAVASAGPGQGAPSDVLERYAAAHPYGTDAEAPVAYRLITDTLGGNGRPLSHPGFHFLTDNLGGNGKPKAPAGRIDFGPGGLGTTGNLGVVLKYLAQAGPATAMDTAYPSSPSEGFSLGVPPEYLAGRVPDLAPAPKGPSTDGGLLSAAGVKWAEKAKGQTTFPVVKRGEGFSFRAPVGWSALHVNGSSVLKARQRTE